MGASAHASLHVGFEVTHDDFWEIRRHTDDHLSCPEGHTEGAEEGRHCSECGGKFGRRSSRSAVPVEGLRRLAGELGKEPHDLVDPDPDTWPDGSLDGLDVFCCDGYSDHDTEEKSHALGLRLASSGDILHMEGGDAVAVDKLNAAVDKVTEVRDRLGLTDRPVCVFLLASCSY